MRIGAIIFLLGAIGCNANTELVTGGPDLSASGGENSGGGGGGPGKSRDGGATVTAPRDGGGPARDGGASPDALGSGGGFTPTQPSDNPVTHAPATNISGATLLAGKDVLDVSVDQGGGVWAVTSTTVYYFAPGHSSPFTYDQKSGLARGWATWTDTWFEPGTYPVTFQSVSGAHAGEAIVGNIGAIADRLQVDPATGAVTRLDNMQVTPANTNAAEYPEHIKRVVAVWKTVVDLNGTFQGTSYLGGFHGFYAFHGLNGDCGCLAFEEHQHYITDTIVGGDDVRALDISVDGDVWQGDRDFVTLLPQRSKGPNTGFFDDDFSVALDVFPNVRDEVWGVASDRAGGVWVASYGNGLAYLQPVTHAPLFWSSATTLPQNHLTTAVLDGKGALWLGTASAGVARLDAQTGGWSYYTASSGLPSNTIRAVYWDKLSTGGKLYIATDNGVGVY